MKKIFFASLLFVYANGFLGLTARDGEFYYFNVRQDAQSCYLFFGRDLSGIKAFRDACLKYGPNKIADFDAAVANLYGVSMENARKRGKFVILTSILDTLRSVASENMSHGDTSSPCGGQGALAVPHISSDKVASSFVQIEDARDLEDMSQAIEGFLCVGGQDALAVPGLTKRKFRVIEQFLQLESRYITYTESNLKASDDFVKVQTESAVRSMQAEDVDYFVFHDLLTDILSQLKVIYQRTEQEIRSLSNLMANMDWQGTDEVLGNVLQIAKIKLLKSMQIVYAKKTVDLRVLNAKDGLNARFDIAFAETDVLLVLFKLIKDIVYNVVRDCFMRNDSAIRSHNSAASPLDWQAAIDTPNSV